MATTETKKERGVKLLLAPGSDRPSWAQYSTRVRVDTEKIGTQWRYVMSIAKAKASFAPGGSVLLKLGRSRDYIVGFEPHQVLEIRNYAGKSLRRNHEYCQTCVTNTGKITDHEPGSVVGRINATFECTNCQNTWSHSNI